MSLDDNKDILKELSQPQPSLKFLYITPEKLATSNALLDVLSRLYEKDLIKRFAIDEAHCVTQWGYDFRPSYQKLKCLRNKFPKVPIMALTATATADTRGDIANQLGMIPSECKWYEKSIFS